MFQEAVKDAFFDSTDKSDIRAETLRLNRFRKMPSSWKRIASIRFTIEGHCDERGSEVVAASGWGTAVPTSRRTYMVSLGIPDDRIETTSHGEGAAVCSEHLKHAGKQIGVRTSS